MCARVRVRVRVRGVRSHTHILLTDPKHMSYIGQGLCSGEGITSIYRQVVKQSEAHRTHAKHNKPLVVCQKTEPIIWVIYTNTGICLCDMYGSVS